MSTLIFRAIRTLFCFFCLLTTASSFAQIGPALEPNRLHLPEKDYQFPFRWLGDSVGDRWEPYSALLLPVTLPGCPRTFYLQFDLGAPSTVFYRNKLQDIHARYPKTRGMEDTSDGLDAYTFQVGKMPVRADRLKLIAYAGPQIDWSQKGAMDIIGTIGADFIENRILRIDYRSRIFSNLNKRPQGKVPASAWSDFLFVQRRVLLPVRIRGKKTLLLFDTGSSAFELLTDRTTAEGLAIPGGKAEKQTTRSWDRTWTATTLPVNDSVVIAGRALPLRSATYMEGVDQAQIEQMMKMGMGGMTGNKLFVHSVLLLDTRTKKFAVTVK